MVTVQPAQHVVVRRTYVTLPANTTNVVRDVYLTRPDGTLLGVEKAVYCTAGGIGLVFENDFLLPSFDNKLKVDTRTVIVTARGDITIECLYDTLERLED